MLNSISSNPEYNVFNTSSSSEHGSNATESTNSQTQIYDELAVEETNPTNLETTGFIGSPGQEAPLAYLTAANRLVKLAGPLSLARLGMAMHGIVNGIVVRNLSPNEMAAVPLAMASISEVYS